MFSGHMNLALCREIVHIINLLIKTLLCPFRLLARLFLKRGTGHDVLLVCCVKFLQPRIWNGWAHRKRSAPHFVRRSAEGPATAAACERFYINVCFDDSFCILGPKSSDVVTARLNCPTPTPSNFSCHSGTQRLGRTCSCRKIMPTGGAHTRAVSCAAVGHAMAAPPCSWFSLPNFPLASSFLAQDIPALPPSFCIAHWCRSTPTLSEAAIPTSRPAVTLRLSAVLSYHSTQPVVQQLWSRMSEQMAGCSDCIQAYHLAQVSLCLHALDPYSEQHICKSRNASQRVNLQGSSVSCRSMCQSAASGSG